MTTPAPSPPVAALAMREKIARVIEGAMSTGALNFDRHNNPKFWKLAVEKLTDEAIAVLAAEGPTDALREVLARRTGMIVTIFGQLNINFAGAPDAEAARAAIAGVKP